MKLSVGLIAVLLAFVCAATAVPAPSNSNEDVEILRDNSAPPDRTLIPLSIFRTFTFPLPSFGGDSDEVAGKRDAETDTSAGAGAGAGAGGAEDDAEGFHNFRGVIDTGAGYPFLQPRPAVHAFNLGFFDSFEDIFRRLHTSLWPATVSDSDETPVGGDGSSGFGGPLFRFNVDDKKGNSSSTVKVVGDHKIEVNETVFGDENNSFRVRVVNVRPLNEGEQVDEKTLTNAGEGAGEANKYDTNSDSDSDEKDEKKRIDGPQQRPATSKPVHKNDNEDSSEERREPLEKNVDQNEQPAQGGQQQQQPSAASEEEFEAIVKQIDAPAAAAQPSAETNKPDVDNNNNKESDSAIAASESVEATATTISAMPTMEELNDGTIENNEETEASDNLNDSPVETATETLTGEVVEQQEEREETTTMPNEAAAAAEDNNSDGDAALTSDLVALELSGAEDASIATSDESSPAMSHSKYAAASPHRPSVDEGDSDLEEVEHGAHREDLSSSDDEGLDAEVPEMSDEFNSEWADLHEEEQALAAAQEEANASNELSNDIDVYDAIPVDLSNDIAVNDIAAAQAGYPLNPDAEFIDTDSDGMLMMGSGARQPRFERISAAPQQASEVGDMK